MTTFPAIGGAQVVGPWINTTLHTWNSIAKISVGGSVVWPSAGYAVTTAGNQRVITTSDLPTTHTTGSFPVARTDPAFAYDRNPNSIAARTISWSLPLTPQAAVSPSCTPGGPVGVLDDGVLLYNALDGEGRDAGAHEVLDQCGEHPQMNSELHHHAVPPCIIDRTTGPSTLVGYAVDGYGIYVERTGNGALVTNADLDACHGRTSSVQWDGSQQVMYHYDATLEYPYAIGCFHGRPVSTHG